MKRGGRKGAFESIIAVTLTCAGAAVSAGCGPECVSGTTRCQGNVLQTCDAYGDTLGATPKWHDRPCAIACRVVGGQALCVAAPEPIADCEGGALDICFGGQHASCRGGYPIAGSPCSGGGHCLMSSCGPICALADTPDPRCSVTAFCDGSDLVGCNCGLIARRDACGADRCREMSGESRCTQSSAPDPRCGDPGQKTSGFCSDNTAYDCWFGFVIGSATCLSGPCVGTGGTSVACQMP